MRAEVLLDCINTVTSTQEKFPVCRLAHELFILSPTAIPQLTS